MNIVFDFGMYDGSDTEYYLEQGFKVVAVEANPVLVLRGRERFNTAIDAGQLEIIHAAIGETNDEVELTTCGDDLGSSSTCPGALEHRQPLAKYKVPGITTRQIIDRHGVPYYMKVDIEGMDWVCVRAITRQTKPQYLSFEISKDLDGQIGHLNSVGFTKFKIINQTSFRELSRQKNLSDKVRRRLMFWLGALDARYVRRGSRFFEVGHSAGPGPWASDGKWSSATEVVCRWNDAQPSIRPHHWYDLHAT